MQNNHNPSRYFGRILPTFESFWELLQAGAPEVWAGLKNSISRLRLYKYILDPPSTKKNGLIMDNIPKEILRIFLGLVPSFGFQRYSPPPPLRPAPEARWDGLARKNAWRTCLRNARQKGDCCDQLGPETMLSLGISSEYDGILMGIWWDFDRKWWFPKLIERKPGKWWVQGSSNLWVFEKHRSLNQQKTYPPTELPRTAQNTRELKAQQEVRVSDGKTMLYYALFALDQSIDDAKNYYCSVCV